MSSGIKKYMVFLFSLATIRFFNFYKIPTQLYIYIFDAIFLGTVVFVILNYKSYHNNKFTFPVFLFLFAILISCFSSTIIWDQKFMLTFKSVTFIMSYVLFFFLVVLEFKVKDIERYIVFLGIAFMIIYFISFVTYPKEIFRYSFFGGDYRGFIRITPYGIGFMFLFSFYSLNRYLIHRKFSWLILYVFTLVFTIMTLTRTLIGVLFILSAFFILHKSRNFYKIVAIIIIGLSIFLIPKIRSIQGLVHITEKQGQEWENYIRIRAADYYLHQFSPNIFAKIFGNGRPAGDSDYDNFVEYQLEKKHHYYLSDLGYVGIYVTYGIFSIVALFIFFLKTIRTNMPEEYLYAKYFLYFAFTVSIINGVFIFPDYIPAIVFATYILTKKDVDQPRYIEKTNLIL